MNVGGLVALSIHTGSSMALWAPVWHPLPHFTSSFYTSLLLASRITHLNELLYLLQGHMRSNPCKKLTLSLSMILLLWLDHCWRRWRSVHCQDEARAKEGWRTGVRNSLCRDIILSLWREVMVGKCSLNTFL
jgi:hypothetical protein